MKTHQGIQADTGRLSISKTHDPRTADMPAVSYDLDTDAEFETLRKRGRKRLSVMSSRGLIGFEESLDNHGRR
jgi:hypothetical protein